MLNELRERFDAWDYRPLARLLLWGSFAVVALRLDRVTPADLSAVLRELILGWLLTFGILTRIQLGLVRLAWWAFLTLDEWSYALAEWLVRPVAGRASFGLNFLAALAAQIALVTGGAWTWRAAALGPRVLALLDAALLAAWRSISGA